MDTTGSPAHRATASAGHQRDGLPSPSSADERTSTAWQELVRQFSFFDDRAQRYQRLHYLLRGTVLFVGAAVPIVALASEARVWVALLGAVVVVGEGLAQLTQAQEHWIRYRSSAESLRAEALSFTTGTGPYGASDRPPSRLDLLAERLNGISEEEVSSWARAARSQPADGGDATSGAED